MYLALYRKYRSKTFDTVVGQKHVTEILKHQVKNNEISHAYLFSGTRGTGKTSVAKILSRAVNCLNPQDGNPCNECNICKEIFKDRLMDVVEMDAASNNGVDDIRELKEKVIYPPGLSKYKVYIIDEVHMLSRGAFNALLKILEEPPSHLIFILATTEPEKIPQTVLSRCQRFNFKRLSVEEIKDNLRYISIQEGKTVEEEVFTLIANNSDGAMRDALSLLDQCFSYDEEITYDRATDILGFTDTEYIFKLCNEIIEKNHIEALKVVDEVFNQGKDLNQFIKDLAFHFRNLLISSEMDNTGNLIYSKDIERYKEQGKKFGTSYILNAISIINELTSQARYAMDVRLVLEMGIVKLIRINNSQLKSVEEVKIEPRKAPVESKKVEERKSKEVKIENRQSEEVKVEIPIKADIINNVVKDEENFEIDNTEKESNVNIEIVKRDWKEILQAIKGKRRFDISALLHEAVPLNYENRLLNLGYDAKFDFHINVVSKDENKTFIENVLKEYYNEDIRVEVSLIDDSVDKRSAIEKLEGLFGKDIIERK